MTLRNFRPTKLPEKYLWIKDYAQRNGPRIMREALKTHGLKEIPGSKHATEILQMAARLGGVVEDFYTKDEIPWCGLAVSYWIKEAGFEPPKNYSQVRARDFASWGRPAKKPSFGDILVFWRGSRAGRDGHVGLYVGEDKDTYHIYGGNQSNSVNITRIKKVRLLAARRCPWRFLQPRGVKPIHLSLSGGNISTNEA